MGRIHLFEFEDLKWFPSSLRNYGTDFLQFLSNKTKMYKPIIPVLKDLLLETRSTHMVDLGSGGGGGLIWLNQELQKEIDELQITLTDFYPNLEAFKHTQEQAKNISYVEESIDARDVPSKLQGLRTMFLSFHHFNKTDAQLILENVMKSGESIAIFEAQERSLTSIIAMLFSPVSVLFTTPFIRPFSLGRILFTYFIPLVPIFVMWDGVVSSLRTYSVAEMKAMIEEVDKKQAYQWQVEKVQSGPGVILYLTGRKK